MTKNLGSKKVFLSLLLVEGQLKGCTANSSVAFFGWIDQLLFSLILSNIGGRGN